MSRWSFWIDRGGAFTDVVARRPDGAVQVRKFLSHNPQVYTEAVTHGMRDFLGLAPEEALPTAQMDAVARRPDGAALRASRRGRRGK